MDFGFDGDLLRHDLLDYYGTAAFNGFPVAMMDVFAVERMSDDELWSQAQRNGFLMDKYTSHQTVSSLNLQSILNYSYASSPASFVPVSNSRNSSKKEDITFPTYETAVPNSFFQMSPESREIISVRPNQWGYKLLAQELKNYAYQLSKLKKQTSDNPYVKRIGHDSEGRPLLYYIVGFSENLENGIKNAEKAASRDTAEFNSIVKKAEKKKKPELITDLSIRLMEPYRVFLGIYNDIELIDVPTAYKQVFSEMRKIVKSLLSDCEMFYYDANSEINKAIDRGEQGSFALRLQLHGFYTKKLSDTVNSNISDLLQSKIVRKLP